MDVLLDLLCIAGIALGSAVPFVVGIFLCYRRTP